MLERWIAEFGYIAIAAGTFLEGETVLLVGGALAHQGILSWKGVAFSAFLGSLIGDQLWFYLGRHFGPRWLAQRPRLQRRFSRAEHALQRYGDRFVVGFRFIAGIRMVAPFLFGATNYGAARFAVLNALGAAVWAVTISLLGFSLGAGMQSVLERAGHVEELALAALVIVGVGAFVTQHLWRSRRATKL